MIYKSDTRDYLLRARGMLDENKPHTLFYAALELRFGIEARLRKYLNIINELSEKKKKGWQIAILDKNIESIFRQGNKLVKLEFFDSYQNRLVELIYTPVSKKLVHDGEKLGELLHSNSHYKTQIKNWFEETQVFLEKIYLELELANKGTLLGPPLFHPKLNRFDFAIEYFEGYNPQEIHVKAGGFGAKIIMKLSYPEKL